MIDIIYREWLLTLLSSHTRVLATFIQIPSHKQAPSPSDPCTIWGTPF